MSTWSPRISPRDQVPSRSVTAGYVTPWDFPSLMCGDRVASGWEAGAATAPRLTMLPPGRWNVRLSPWSASILATGRISSKEGIAPELPLEPVHGYADRCSRRLGAAAGDGSGFV